MKPNLSHLSKIGSVVDANVPHVKDEKQISRWKKHSANHGDSFGINPQKQYILFLHIWWVSWSFESYWNPKSEGAKLPPNVEDEQKKQYMDHVLVV